MRLSIDRPIVEEMGLKLQNLLQGMADETLSYTEPIREWHSIGDDKRMVTEWSKNDLHISKSLHCSFWLLENQMYVCAQGLRALFGRWSRAQEVRQSS
jgi:hypothetical protein